MIPGFVDSHSHLVFAGDRTAEFNARMSGRAYSAGGIRTTVAATRAATDEELEANLTRYLREALRQGTTTFETKSGYGLTVADEARALRIAAAHTDEVTYLGAHIVSPDHAEDPAAYVALVTGEMLDACAPYARWIDVFCEKGAFDGDQARAILTAGRAKGLHPRIHANQLSYGPGVQLAVELDAASADHCTHLTDVDVDALANSRTVATLLPGAEFSTRAQWPDARRLLDAGVTVALSTDCNPGSSFTSSVPFCVALAVRDMGMTPDEAVWSATAGVRGRSAATTSAASRRARTPISRCWTRPATSTSPTGREFRWSRAYGAGAYAWSDRPRRGVAASVAVAAEASGLRCGWPQAWAGPAPARHRWPSRPDASAKATEPSASGVTACPGAIAGRITPRESTSNLRLSPLSPSSESHSQTPTPSSVAPRLSRHRSGSANDWRAFRRESRRQRWVAREVQVAVTTSVPFASSPRMSRHSPEAMFTTWA